jgi:hypothetical protein
MQHLALHNQAVSQNESNLRVFALIATITLSFVTMYHLYHDIKLKRMDLKKAEANNPKTY